MKLAPQATLLPLVKVPGDRTVQLVARDGNGVALKHVHAGINLKAGETLGCVGCHEYRLSEPPVIGQKRAFARPPTASYE